MPPSFTQRSSERLRWLSEIEKPAEDGRDARG